MSTRPTPAQQRALDGLMRGWTAGNTFVLQGATGMGKTTVLREVHRGFGGAFLTLKELVNAMRGQHPLAFEETFTQMVMEALVAHDVVIVDDLGHVNQMLMCATFYPRTGFFYAALASLTTYAAESGKKLLFATEGGAPDPVSHRCYTAQIDEFGVEDYEFLCRAYLGPTVGRRIDYAKIHRFAPELNAHQIRNACVWLRQERGLDTERFIDYLRSREMASNVDLREVQEVDLHDLHGIDDILESLEANIVLPLENDALAAELKLKPKRGVLLVGPPGTGKTTIGRALARRLQSKFFLIDGTFISGSPYFYHKINEVFTSAKRNAPSIIFIDDSDAIFENREEIGLYRYLLTMLDGLESESAGRICVMMTAMDVGHLPPALLRSGRIELWLEMRLPTEDARAAILRRHLAGLPAELTGVEMPRLIDATDGFTGADLKCLVEDGKALYAYDRVRDRPPSPATHYFLAAVETVRANKERYAVAETRARSLRPSRSAHFDLPPLIPEGPV
jgi:ATP-dependent 26S proteasome regulatory subunit